MLDLLSVLLILVIAAFATGGYFRGEARRRSRSDPIEDAETLRRLDKIEQDAKARHND